MNCRVAFDDFHDFSRKRRMLDRQLYRPPDATLELWPPRGDIALFYHLSIDLNYLSTMKRRIKIDPIKLWEIIWKGGRMVGIIGLARSKLV